MEFIKTILIEMDAGLMNRKLYKYSWSNEKNTV